MAGSVLFPPAFHSAGESCTFLLKYKQSLEKRLSLTRSKELYEAVHLAVYLVAMEREVEALEVAAFLPAQITFTGNHSVWHSAARAITIASFLLRKRRQEAAADALLAKLIQNPSHADREREFYQESVDKRIPADLEAARADPSRKWACHKLATALSSAIYWRETNRPGFHHHGYYRDDAVEQSIAKGFPYLRQRIEP